MAKIKKKITKLPKHTTPLTRGRPTKYLPEFCDKVIEVMAKGYSKEAVAGHLGIHKDTLYQWEKAHGDFSDALKTGLELSRMFWEKTAIDNLVYSPKGKKADAVLWIFNMKNRFNWTDKKEVELGEQTRKGFGFKLDISPDMLDDSPDAIEGNKD